MVIVLQIVTYFFLVVGIVYTFSVEAYLGTVAFGSFLLGGILRIVCKVEELERKVEELERR